MSLSSVSREFFEAKYRKDADPWCFASSPYELNRYSKILEILGARRFHRGFEPGCSIGVLTEQLAKRCDNLIAMDISPSAVRMARERCAGRPGVEVLEGALPNDLPGGNFDLMVMSEVGYYFEDQTLAKLVDRMLQRLEPAGLLVAAHWLGESRDHIISGDEVHRVLRANPELRNIESRRYEGFVLDSWERM